MPNFIDLGLQRPSHSSEMSGMPVPDFPAQASLAVLATDTGATRPPSPAHRFGSRHFGA